MFRTKGANKEDRWYHRDLIIKTAKMDVGAGIVLSAIYFEWAIRRTILALGKSPVGQLNELYKADKRLGMDELQKLWNVEVANRGGMVRLPDVFDLRHNKMVFGKLKLTWRDIDRARLKRNAIVHGGRCSPMLKCGMDYVELQLAAAETLADLVEKRGKSIYRPIRRR